MTEPIAERILPVLDRRAAWTFAAGVVAAGCLALTTRTGALTSVDAIVLGAVEGITEFLPISSTGHLLVVERLLGLGSGSAKSAADTYAVAIQLGAIAAVVGVYRSHIASMARGIVGRDAAGLGLLKMLAVAFLPAAIVGFALDDTIKAHLFGIWPVIAAWIAGGVLLLRWQPSAGRIGLPGVTYRHAALIGAAQVLALWPGTSRSLGTIAAALALGLTTSAAIEFSFLLGLGTLSAATALDLTKGGGNLLNQFGLAMPLLGAIVAALTAAIAVNWFVAYLKTRPLTLFGWYRLAVAALAVGLAATHMI